MTGMIDVPPQAPTLLSRTNRSRPVSCGYHYLPNPKREIASTRPLDHREEGRPDPPFLPSCLLGKEKRKSTKREKKGQRGKKEGEGGG